MTTFNWVSIKDRRILMISLINHASILRDAKIIMHRISLTTIVHNAVGRGHNK